MNDSHGMSAMNNRRDILRGCLRCGGLFVVGGVAAALAWRGPHGNCLRSDPCGACPLFTGCGLPKAHDAKSHGTASPAAAASNNNARSKHA